MTEDMVLLQQQFAEVRDLVEARAEPDRVVPLLEALRIRVLFQVGLCTAWDDLFRRPTR
jgi:hypothetical protein